MKKLLILILLCLSFNCYGQDIIQIIANSMCETVPNPYEFVIVEDKTEKSGKLYDLFDGVSRVHTIVIMSLEQTNLRENKKIMDGAMETLSKVFNFELQKPWRFSDNYTSTYCVGFCENCIIMFNVSAKIIQMSQFYFETEQL